MNGGGANEPRGSDMNLGWEYGKGGDARGPETSPYAAVIGRVWVQASE